MSLPQVSQVFLIQKGFCWKAWISICASIKSNSGFTYQPWFFFDYPRCLVVFWLTCWVKFNGFVCRRVQMVKRTRLAKRNMSYTREQRAEIGRWAAEKGSTSASRKFKVPNSTVRSIKNKYLEALENGQVGPTMVIISWKGSVDLSITGRLTTWQCRVPV